MVEFDLALNFGSCFLEGSLYTGAPLKSRFTVSAMARSPREEIDKRVGKEWYNYSKLSRARWGALGG